jgi:hypothetical protein
LFIQETFARVLIPLLKKVEQKSTLKSGAKSVATESVATESVATESVATESVATESVATEIVAINKIKIVN